MTAVLPSRDCRAELSRRLAEPRPAHVLVLCGPRQVGKTTLLLDLARQAEGEALYATADAPEAALPAFWDRLWTLAENVAAAKGRVRLFVDEAHVLDDWPRRLGDARDRFLSRNLPIHLVAAVSSGLRTADDLGARFEKLVLTHWSASTLARELGLAAEDAAVLAARMGTYPRACSLRDDAARWSAYVLDAIVEPAVARDIPILADVRRPALLRQVLAFAVSSPAQVVTLQKLQTRLHDGAALETIAHYLSLLEDAFLVAALPKYPHRDTRRRAAPPKLVALNNALLALMDPPQPRSAPAGDVPARWVENACLAHACNAGQRVSYWREEPFDVDAVIEGSWGSWAVEVKTGAFEMHELQGLRELTTRHRDLQPLVICDAPHHLAVERAGLRATTWQAFLLDGPPTSS